MFTCLLHRLDSHLDVFFSPGDFSLMCPPASFGSSLTLEERGVTKNPTSWFPVSRLPFFSFFFFFWFPQRRKATARLTGCAKYGLNFLFFFPTRGYSENRIVVTLFFVMLCRMYQRFPSFREFLQFSLYKPFLSHLFHTSGLCRQRSFPFFSSLSLFFDWITSVFKSGRDSQCFVYAAGYFCLCLCVNWGHTLYDSTLPWYQRAGESLCLSLIFLNLYFIK